ncbi:hypothetical protein Mpsy_0768 [Methanolobus psychrophilus R15]|nr:hypothetical protein Mpsy_0768 [Methanolobus psychrophilus R15]
MVVCSKQLTLFIFAVKGQAKREVRTAKLGSNQGILYFDDRT